MKTNFEFNVAACLRQKLKCRQKHLVSCSVILHLVLIFYPNLLDQQWIFASRSNTLLYYSSYWGKCCNNTVIFWISPEKWSPSSLWPLDCRGLYGSAGEGPARGTAGLQKPWGRGLYGEKDLGHDGDRLRLGMDPRLNSMVMLEDKLCPQKGCRRSHPLGSEKQIHRSHGNIQTSFFLSYRYLLLCIPICHAGQGYQGLNNLRPCIAKSWHAIHAYARVYAISNCKML